ncbi:DNA translocase FtsK, partial [Burkholderia ubonensis]|uniref:DNA translocase FtsK n=1 Tax=Burkholderia ubonensis TaxID=101571 RepID=UPI000A9B74F1
ACGSADKGCGCITWGLWKAKNRGNLSLAHDDRVNSLEELRGAIRAHWHRGALALWEAWRSSDENYDLFIETLVRRSEMPDFAEQVSDESDSRAPKEPKFEDARDVSTEIAKALAELGIRVQIKESLRGPRITRYKVLVMNLADSAKLKRSMPQLGIALNLGNALPVMIPGDEAKTVFIDVPRPKSTWMAVGIERLREWSAGARDPNKLMLYVGVDVTGQDVSFDLASTPHLLVAGATGMGKSVCLHSLLLSLLLRHKPETLQLALIDPKRVELAPYSKLPNLYGEAIATEVPAARQMLEALCAEMDMRYSIFSQLSVNNITEARRKGKSIPYIVCVIEEMADLLMEDDGVEQLIARLAQKARAAGIHLVLATQRPDAKTVTGLIRSNVPGRIALTVQKGTESTIILDETGAESLLGAGDMLVRLAGEGLRRAHGVFVKLEHVIQIVNMVGK